MTFLSASAAAADELVAILGLEGFGSSSDTDGVLGLEWHGTKDGKLLEWDHGPVAGLTFSSDGDAFLGAGLSVEHAFGHETFFEASLMPGVHIDDVSGARDGNIAVRALIGIGTRAFERTLSLGLSYTASSGNSPRDTISLRIRRRF